MCSDIPHTSAHSGIATERREPGLQLGRAGRRPPPLSEHLVCVLNLQESCLLAKTSFILIFNFIFFGAKHHFYYVKTMLSCHILRSRKGEVFREGGPSTAPRHRTSGLAQIGVSSLSAGHVLCAASPLRQRVADQSAPTLQWSSHRPSVEEEQGNAVHPWARLPALRPTPTAAIPPSGLGG